MYVVANKVRLSVLGGGDIETNPGPVYNTDKVVVGMFHKGGKQFQQIFSCI